MATKPKYVGVTPIDPNSSNPTWQYRLKLKLADGKVVDTRIKKDLNGQPFMTARAAYEARKAHESRLLSMPLESPPEPSETLLREIYVNYLATDGKTKAPATLRKQDSMWRIHVEPAFGDREINSITVIELDSFLFDIYQTHSYKYVEGFLKFFYLLFGHADRMEVINPDRYYRMFVNRSTRLNMPKIKQEDYIEDLSGAVVYSDIELYKMENIFKSEDGNLLIAFYIGLYCGLRIAECFGLRWSDIDWTNKTLTVNRQMNYYEGSPHLCSVKTLAAVRSVLVPDFLYGELSFWFDYQNHLKETLGGSYKDFDRVYDEITKEWIISGDFINRKKNGELLTVNSMKYWAKKIKKELGIEFKYHNLRHTYATRAAAQNVPIFKLMSMLGHKKVDTTKQYYMNTDDPYMIDYTRNLINTMYDKARNPFNLYIDKKEDS